MQPCILFIAVCTESDGKLNGSLAMRLYHMILGNLIDIATHVHVSAHTCHVHMHVWEGEVFDNSALYE